MEVIVTETEIMPAAAWSDYPRYWSGQVDFQLAPEFNAFRHLAVGLGQIRF